jgi:glyoxylase-like metal-dependent hydrolase (beta-lactamase superfamily II)
MGTITTLDTNWTGRPRSIAACLLESDGHASVLDPGPASTIETLREKLRGHGLSVGDLSALLLTHIHLDHAGACGSLVRENPRLLVYVHRIGAPHMADPSRLLASAGLLYRDKMQQLYGAFLAVPQENLRILEGGETLTLGARKLDVLHTPGHASHHVSYFDGSEGIAFVGDTTGIHDEGESLVLPVTPPPDINLEIWETSLDAILARRPSRLYLTHFGFSDDVAGHMAQHRERLHRWATLAVEILHSGQDAAAAQASFIAGVRGEIEQEVSGNEAAYYAFNGGLDLSWLGLARYWRKRESAATARP